MKRIVLILAVMTASVAGRCNDGVFYVNGNHLVPIQETDIALTKEVLTISLCDDGYARVDVQYVLTNSGKEKTVTMGFEAGAPYNDDVAFNPKGIHPYISERRGADIHERGGEIGIPHRLRLPTTQSETLEIIRRDKDARRRGIAQQQPALRHLT